MSPRRNDIADVLRTRLIAMMRAGALAPGERLPSTRDLARQFDADPRVIQAAYRLLEKEGLVQSRPRSGIYAAERPLPDDKIAIAREWIVETIAQGLEREIPATRLPQLIRESLSRRPFHAVTIATTADQNDAMCRELREDFGLRTTCIAVESLDTGSDDILRSADAIVTTEMHGKRIRRLAKELGKPVVVISIRDDLVGPAWRQLLHEHIYVVIADRRFIPILTRFFSSTPRAHNIRPLVLDEDDLAQIPGDALVYITYSARQQMGRRKVAGRIIPTARVFSPACTREILDIVVRANAHSGS